MSLLVCQQQEEPERDQARESGEVEKCRELDQEVSESENGSRIEHSCSQQIEVDSPNHAHHRQEHEESQEVEVELVAKEVSHKGDKSQYRQQSIETRKDPPSDSFVTVDAAIFGLYVGDSSDEEECVLGSWIYNFKAEGVLAIAIT